MKLTQIVLIATMALGLASTAHAQMFNADGTPNIGSGYNDDEAQSEFNLDAFIATLSEELTPEEVAAKIDAAIKLATKGLSTTEASTVAANIISAAATALPTQTDSIQSAGVATGKINADDADIALITGLSNAESAAAGGSQEQADIKQEIKKVQKRQSGSIS